MVCFKQLQRKDLGETVDKGRIFVGSPNRIKWSFKPRVVAFFQFKVQGAKAPEMPSKQLQQSHQWLQEIDCPDSLLYGRHKSDTDRALKNCYRQQ